MIKLFRSVFDTHRYLFADLDGTLIDTKSGKLFPKDKNDWVLKNDVIKAIKKYDPEYLFIASNQGGIEKGFVKLDDFIQKITSICKEIHSEIPGLVIAYRYCSSNDKNNYNRKPNPGMIEDLMDVYDCRKSQCLMIGDASGLSGQFSDSDKKCAENADIKYMDINEFVEKYGR